MASTSKDVAHVALRDVAPGASYTPRRGNVCLSKQKFADIKRLLEDTVGDAKLVSVILEGVQRITGFDPAVSTYTAAHKQASQNWRTRVRAELGQSLYVLEGRQAAYNRSAKTAASAAP